MATPLSMDADNNAETRASTPAQLQPVLLSDEERGRGRPFLSTVQTALETFHRNGIVVLSNAISHKYLDHVSERMIAENKTLLTWSDAHYNHGRSAQNLSQCPPLSLEFLHEEVWANRHAVAVLEYLLGNKPQLSFVGGNVAIPNSTGRQAVHSDAYTEHPDFTYGIEVNIYLDEVSPRNGSTELWLGSHKGSNVRDHVPQTRGWIKKERLDEVAEVAPPLQPTIPKGSICLRDLRLWHSGMPNRSDRPRIMLAFIFFPSWFRTPMRLTLSRDTQSILKSWDHIDALSNTRFLDGPVDHLRSPFALNLTQDPNGAIGNSGKKRKLDAEATVQKLKKRVTSDNYWLPSPSSSQ